tara:strand:- start:1751 stop:2197 length:447 start_codon:yes stop_codon:yes gene_type:complete
MSRILSLYNIVISRADYAIVVEQVLPYLLRMMLSESIEAELFSKILFAVRELITRIETMMRKEFNRRKDLEKEVRESITREQSPSHSKKTLEEMVSQEFTAKVSQPGSGSRVRIELEREGRTLQEENDMADFKDAAKKANYEILGTLY